VQKTSFRVATSNTAKDSSRNQQKTKVANSKQQKKIPFGLQKARAE
jgi:hypothetical protein